jgi:multimeric flavodoxin WrbA
MKVVAFNGSPRKKGNTYQAIGMVMEVLENEGIDTEIVQVGGMSIGPCKACGLCRKEKDGFCHGYKRDEKDILNDCMKKMYEAQGVIIGSPVYFGSVTAEIKALIDRSGYSSRGGDGTLLRRKVCAGIAVLRRQGAAATLEQINNLFLLGEGIVCYSSYWNMAFGKGIGEIADDDEGVKTLKKLGENMAWLLKKLY